MKKLKVANTKQFTEQANILYLQHRVQILSRSWVYKGKAEKIKERVKIKHSNK